MFLEFQKKIVVNNFTYLCKLKQEKEEEIYEKNTK